MIVGGQRVSGTYSGFKTGVGLGFGTARASRTRKPQRAPVHLCVSCGEEKPYRAIKSRLDLCPPCWEKLSCAYRVPMLYPGQIQAWQAYEAHCAKRAKALDHNAHGKQAYEAELSQYNLMQAQAAWLRRMHQGALMPMCERDLNLLASVAAMAPPTPFTRMRVPHAVEPPPRIAWEPDMEAIQAFIAARAPAVTASAVSRANDRAIEASAAVAESLPPAPQPVQGPPKLTGKCQAAGCGRPSRGVYCSNTCAERSRHLRKA